MADLARIVAAYIETRNQKKEVTERHKQELEPINARLDKIEAALLKYMNATGSESIRTTMGTAYKSIRASAKVVDWDACLDYIKANDFWHLLERRVSKTAVEELAAANGEMPPGISVNSEVTVNIRSS